MFPKKLVTRTRNKILRCTYLQMIFFETYRMNLKLTAFFIEVNDIKIFVKRELLGQKEKKS